MTDETTETVRPWRIAVLISGSGRTLANLLAVIDRGELDAEIVQVISSVPRVGGLMIAEDAGIPTSVVRRRDFENVEAYSAGMYEAMAPYAPDLVVMAGFLRQLLVFPGWEGRIFNIHPALLPEAGAYAAGKGLYGERVHAAVLAQGDRESGATVHVVTNEYDEGPPLARAVVPIEPDDTAETLAQRIFTAECELYPEAIRAYIAAHPHLKR